MKKSIFILWLLLPVIAISADDNCLTCHLDFEDDDGPSHMITRDIHIQKGLGCVDCHGGDASLEDMDDVREVQGYQGVPSYSEIPNFCAKCHSDAAYMRNHNPSLPTDQFDKYKVSIHGKLLVKGDKKVANCISCHTVHEISDGKIPHSSTHPLNLPYTCGKCHADEAYMSDYKIPTNQLEGFEKSVHGIALLVNKDLGAPACNDCHSNHGAAPPGVSSLAAVCGTCHALEAELFAKSPHNEAFADNDFPMCETCHSNHYIEKPSDVMIGSSEAAKCVECHDRDDGTRGLATADSILDAITTLVVARHLADSVLDEAIVRGMHTTDDELLLKEVDQTLIKARTHVHSFDVAQVLPNSQEGVAKADTVTSNAGQLIEEYYFRRKGLGWATLFITILAFGLYWKIRKLG